MNLRDFLYHLVEDSRTKADSFRTTGQAIKKERAIAGSSDKKAKDAARKRAERSRQTPRAQKSKEELVKEIIPVKTQSGRVQLIFKDSFDKGKHTKLSKSEQLSYEEAKTYTREPSFEQTGASKLLFGDVKQKTTAPQQRGAGKEQSQTTKERTVTTKEQPKKEVAAKGEPDDLKQQDGELPKEKKQAKKLSKEEIFMAMSQMTPEQLSQVPFEIRQEYFMQTRKPTSGTTFDSLTFEKLTNVFGINTLTAVPYNQQVINALIFLAKIKAGASDQEIQSYAAIAPNSLEFTKIAFSQARKILSQMGEECIQKLISAAETGSQPTAAEGAVDMECGDYKFKISAGGEFLITTDKFDQKSKVFRGLLNAAITQTLQNPGIARDPKMQGFAKEAQSISSSYGNMLMSRESFETAKKDPELLSQLQTIELTDSSGKKLGPVVDQNGKLNKFASFETYRDTLSKATTKLFKNTSKNPSEFADLFVQNILKIYYRGDAIKDPKTAPNHLITQNGIFPMTDSYFSEVSRTATIEVKPVKAESSTDNISRTDKKSALMNKFLTVVEQKEPEKPSIESLFVSKDTIDPIQLALSQASQNMDFDINVSLLPGFSPKDLNVIEYNYIKIGKKTIKIPVEKTELIALELQESVAIIANDILIEALSNNFILSKLVKTKLITSNEANWMTNPKMLNENTDGLKIIYKNLVERAEAEPKLFLYVLNAFQLNEKYQRDYKMEYRNYHGKAKQRKERAKRTAAREALIKNGKVKKGSSMDVDHKKPLRSGGSNGINNLRLRHKSDNRSDNGHKKGEKQDKDWK